MGDGLLAVENLGENFGHNRSLKFLIVDAGSNDNSLAMSCPPPAFLQPEFLKATQSLLQDSGLLVVNCVTRSEEAFQQALASIKVHHEYQNPRDGFQCLCFSWLLAGIVVEKLQQLHLSLPCMRFCMWQPRCKSVRLLSLRKHG